MMTHLHTMMIRRMQGHQATQSRVQWQHDLRGTIQKPPKQRLQMQHHEPKQSRVHWQDDLRRHDPKNPKQRRLCATSKSCIPQQRAEVRNRTGNAQKIKLAPSDSHTAMDCRLITKTKQRNQKFFASTPNYHVMQQTWCEQ